MIILTLLTLAAGAVLLGFGAYLLFLTLAGLAYRHPRGQGELRTRFAVMVPAHNEELLIPRLLESLAAMDYPRDMYRVFVVADNCTDGTASAARNLGAEVFERQNTDLRGKGHALRWLLPRVQSSGASYDAYLLLDADTVVSANFLAVMDQHLQMGRDVVQSDYTVGNAQASPVSALRYLAMALVHRVRPRGREVLGLSCGLFGTGMVFRREVLDHGGWDAFSLAEDAEFHLRLLERGLTVGYAGEAVLASDMPASLREARSQNLRWEKGRLALAREYGPRLLAQGILERRPAKLDAAIQQALPPLSLVLPATLLLLPLGFFSGNLVALAVAVAANLALLGHVAIGLPIAGVPLRAYRALAYVPIFVVWKGWVYLAALRPSPTQWVRTQRPGR